jgi:hypothetical protein
MTLGIGALTNILALVCPMIIWGLCMGYTPVTQQVYCYEVDYKCQHMTLGINMLKIFSSYKLRYKTIMNLITPMCYAKCPTVKKLSHFNTLTCIDK